MNNNRTMAKHKNKAKKAAALKAALNAAKVQAVQPSKKKPVIVQLKGRGDYATLGGNLGKEVGGVVDSIGRSVKAFRRLFGGGDYSTQKANCLITPRKNTLFNADSFDHPVMNLEGTQYAFEGPRPRIQHREFVAPIMTPAAGTTFATQSYNLNPGLSRTFPWLSQVAPSFQAYQLNGCVFQYESTSSDYATGTALGDVTISSQYDMNRSPFDTDQEVKDSAYSTHAKPSVSFLHPIECAKKMTLTQKHMIRVDTDPIAERDELLYDWCRVQVSTTGVTTPATPVKLGNLYVVYDVTLEQPNIHPTRGAGLISLFSSLYDAPPGSSSWNCITDSSALGTARRYRQVNGLNLVPYNGGAPVTGWTTATQFAVPPAANGYYLFVKNLACKTNGVTNNSFQLVGSGVTRLSFLTGANTSAATTSAMYPNIGYHLMSNGLGTSSANWDTCYDSFGATITNDLGYSFIGLYNFAGTTEVQNLIGVVPDNWTTAPTTMGVDVWVIKLPAEFYPPVSMSLGRDTELVESMIRSALAKYGLGSVSSSSNVPPRIVAEDRGGLEVSPYLDVADDQDGFCPVPPPSRSIQIGTLDTKVRYTVPLPRQQDEGRK